MIVRQFNESGTSEFRAFLARCRLDPGTPIPLSLLEDNAHTEVVSPLVTVDPRKFSSRGQAAQYFRDALSPLPDAEVAMNAGLWTWLSLFYFDEVCPPWDGKHDVTNDYSYVFEPRNSRHFYRHLLFIAWRVLQVAPEHNRLFLGRPVFSLDKMTTEVMKRLYLTRVPCIFEVLDRLYWDGERGRERLGVIDMKFTRPGDLVHRFPIRIRQLEKTYDLQSLSADQLIDLLGDEFVFKSNGASPTRAKSRR